MWQMAAFVAFLLGFLVLISICGSMLKHIPTELARRYRNLYLLALALIVASSLLPGNIFDGSWLARMTSTEESAL